MAQYTPHHLDRFIAPECSTVAACLAPEHPELPNYVGLFFLNNLFIFDATLKSDDRKADQMIIVFLRRLTVAIREYRAGRNFLERYVTVVQEKNDDWGLYLRALSHFEHAIIDCYLALLAHNAMARIYRPNTDKSYNRGDGSPAQRLSILYNAVKHFDEWVLNDAVSDICAPVWLADAGIKCANKRHQSDTTTLRYDELCDLFRELEEDARFVAEDVYRIAAERRATRDANTLLF